MVKTGLEVLFQHRKSILAGKRIGLLVNPSSIDSRLRFSVDLFRSEPSWKLVALFGPEHGIRAEMQDQESCAPFRDPSTGLPVFSLYGDRLMPSAEMLDGVDVVVFDIQDVGSRYYTFVHTLSFVMEACKELRKEVVVLDRPNPLGGVEVEGPVLEKGYESFVGRFPVSIRHGMTVGELALFFHQVFGLDCNLEVVEMESWRREYFFEDTKLPWVFPSPNMPTVDTAIVYPGMCLLEGTNISEGRGTTRPFEIFGASWIEPERLCKALAAFPLPGVQFRPVYFRPTFHKYQNQLCGGAQIHVTNRFLFRPVKTALCVLSVLLTEFSGSFRWKDPPYEYVTDRLPIDILFGNAWVREDLEKGVAPDQLEGKWIAGTETFRKQREKYFLYE